MARAWDDWGHRLVTVEKERKGLCESNFETEINAGNSLAACGERIAQKSWENKEQLIQIQIYKYS